MWKISVISDDWVNKGCHIHINWVELAVRPDHRNQIIFRKVFSSTSDADFDAAARIAENLLRDENFRFKLCDSIDRAMPHLLEVTGRKKWQARGRLRELNFLRVILNRMEIP